MQISTQDDGFIIIRLFDVFELSGKGRFIAWSDFNSDSDYDLEAQIFNLSEDGFVEGGLDEDDNSSECSCENGGVDNSDREGCDCFCDQGWGLSREVKIPVVTIRALKKDLRGWR